MRARLESVFDTVACREQKMCMFENRIQKPDESEDQFMLELVQLYRSANPGAPDREFQKAIKRKFIQGISPALRRALYVFCNDPYSVIVNYQRLLEYTRTAKLNLVGNQTPEGGTSMDVINAVNTPAPISLQAPLLSQATGGFDPNTVNVNTEFVQAVADLTSAVNSLNMSPNFQGNQRGANRSNWNGNTYRGGNWNRSGYKGGSSYRGNNWHSNNRGRSRGRGNFSNNRRPSNSNQGPLLCHNCGKENHRAIHCTKN